MNSPPLQRPGRQVLEVAISSVPTLSAAIMISY